MGATASANNALGSSWYKKTGLNATPDLVKNASSTIYIIEVDCTGNTGENVFVCLYNTASPTVGTTAPRCVFPGIAGAKKTYVAPKGLQCCTSALSVAAKTAGGTGGTTNPSGTVKVKINFT